MYISYASQCNATLQILSSYTLIKHIRMFAFSLKYLYRTNYLQFTTLPIIMCFPNSSVGLHPDAHFCVRIKCIITNNGMRIKYKNPNQFSQCVFSKTCSIHYPSWRRYTFLSHLTTKSKISVRWIKKPVAVTCGVHSTKQSIRILQPPPYLQGIFNEKRLDEVFSE